MNAEVDDAQAARTAGSEGSARTRPARRLVLDCNRRRIVFTGTITSPSVLREPVPRTRVGDPRCVASVTLGRRLRPITRQYMAASRNVRNRLGEISGERGHEHPHEAPGDAAIERHPDHRAGPSQAPSAPSSLTSPAPMPPSTKNGRKNAAPTSHPATAHPPRSTPAESVHHDAGQGRSKGQKIGNPPGFQVPGRRHDRNADVAN